MIIFIAGIIFALTEYSRHSSFQMMIVAGFLPLILTSVCSVAVRYICHLGFYKSFESIRRMWVLSPLYLLTLMPHGDIKNMSLFMALMIFIFGSILIQKHALEACMVSENRLHTYLLALSGVSGLFLFQTCIYHDALWTYGYARSIAFDFDVNFFNEFFLHNEYFMYVPSPEIPIFYAGLSFILLPLFYVASLVNMGLASFGIHFPFDGYSPPYKITVSFAMSLLNITGYIVIYRILRLFYEARTSFWAVSILLWCGNGLFYVYTWPLYVHGMDVLVISVFYLLCARSVIRAKSFNPWLTGSVFGLMLWMRPQNVLHGVVILPVFYDLWNSQSKVIAVRTILAFMISAIIFSIPQAILWVKNFNQIYVDVYAHIGDDFFWSNPAFWQMFFGANKGLFVWNPVFALLPFGLIGFLKRFPRFGGVALCAALAQMYLVAAYEFPDGGAGFGTRYLQCLYPFFALCLAALVEKLKTREYMWASILCFFGILNVGLILGYHLEKIPHNDPYVSYGDVLFGWIQGIKSLPEFVLSTHINENMGARPLWVAWYHNDIISVMMFIGIVSATFGILCMVFKFISYFSLSGGMNIFLSRTCMLTGVLTSLAFCMLPSRDLNLQAISILKKSYPSLIHQPVSEKSELWLDQNQREVHLPLPDIHKARQLFVVSSVIEGHDQLEVAENIATLTLQYQDGSRKSVSLRYHLNTGIYETSDQKTFNEAKLQPYAHWLDSENHAFFYGRGYLAMFDLSENSYGPLTSISVSLSNRKDIRLLMTGIYVTHEV